MSDYKMEKIKKLIQSAKLNKAIEYTVSQLKDYPSELELRCRMVELLCLDGQLERADKQLTLLIKQHPDCLIGGSNLRLLIRAAQARVDFSQGADTATLINEADASLEPLVRMRIAMREKDDQILKENANKLEESRRDIAVEINGYQKDVVRDLDDSFAGYLEVFGTDGKYYLIPFEDLISLSLKPVTSLVELCWRKAEIDIKGGMSGEAFIPVTYLGSDTDALKLGRETDWFSIEEADVWFGKGQKMLLSGDDAIPLSQISRIQSISERME
ncbi:Protein of avirulence locus ImpE [Photobacterium marinum]|uniref:Protein of avirulence locus ImpE n=1 Tax=Photobacterium marinum TaxID=1056511 RepID=L8JAL7_9GAMM|nr:type VI secretion system accessory protein TagJ [Photobacterium marinum]ELR64599.1 Protein of avirulence locus ImpE [Photobacterium marinum]